MTEQYYELEELFNNHDNRALICHILLGSMSKEEIVEALQTRLDSDNEGFEDTLGAIMQVADYRKDTWTFIQEQSEEQG